MIRPHAFRPSVDTLENRRLPSAAIYSVPLLNVEQASYVAQAARGDNPVVFFGDSITFGWGTGNSQAPGNSVFARDFAPMGAANFGIYGDTTMDLVERVWGGDFAGKPKVAVVMIGFNNLNEGQTPLQAATGVVGVIQTIQQASPRTTILLLGALPSEVATVNPEIQQFDRLISVLGNDPGVVYEDPGAAFLGANEAARPGLLMDNVHPNLAGYTLIAQEIDPMVVKLLAQADYVADRPIPARQAKAVKAESVVPPRPTTQAPEVSALAFVPNVVSADSPTVTVPTPPPAKLKSAPAELINVATT